jgi:hypothetical protein
MTDVKRKRRRAAPQGIAPSEPERDILDQYLYEVSTYPCSRGTRRSSSRGRSAPATRTRCRSS